MLVHTKKVVTLTHNEKETLKNARVIIKELYTALNTEEWFDVNLLDLIDELETIAYTDEFEDEEEY